MKRFNRLKWNTIASLAVQLAAILSSFIVPKCILNAYGSATNGMVSSITSFLGFLTLMESGVGSVARAELYRPVAEKDTEQTSVVVNATHDFFRKVAFLYLMFVAAFAIIFPLAVDSGENFWYTFFLVLIIAVTNLVQYYFGAGYMQVLYADQKLYLLYSIQAISYLLSVVLTIWLTNIGATIHLVKLASALVFIIRPIAVNIYVKKEYSIRTDAVAESPVLQQKWNNMFQTIAYFVHSKTDAMVLTVFCTFEDVSVYAVYAMVTTGLSSVISSMCNGFTSRIGSQYGKKDEKLRDTFSAYELFVFNLTAICFTTAACVIQDFVFLYTRNLTDAEYRQPLFGLLLILAEAVFCIRMPYNNMVSSAGHFRQTQRAAIIEAGLNITLSVILVWKFGLVGVAVGTLIAMAYRTGYLVVYLTRNILNCGILKFMKKVIVFGAATVISGMISSRVTAFIYPNGFLPWAVKSAITLLITCVAVGIADTVLFSRETKLLFREFF